MADCPVLSQSKLQNKAALSTVKTEVIALAHSCRRLLPIMDMIAVLEEAVGLPKGLTTMHLSIYEDSAGALILAEKLLPQYLEVSIMLSRSYDFVKI